MQRGSIVLQSVGWIVLLVSLLALRGGPIGGGSMSVAGVALLVAAGVGVIATSRTDRPTWMPASLMAAVVLARPVAATFDAPWARMLLISVGPMAVAVAVWWLTKLVRIPRSITAMAVIAAVVAVIADVVFRDPYREQFCHPLCSPSPWAISHRPDLTAAAQWSVLATTVMASVLVVRALFDSEPTPWRMMMVAAIAGAGTLVGVEGTRRLRNAPGSEVTARWMTSQLLLITVAVIAGLVPLFARLLRGRRVARWATLIESTSMPGGVLEMLRGEVGDPSLALVETAAPHTAATPRRAITSFTRNGRVVAAVEHHSDATDRVRVIASVPVVAALENETLLATARHELDELRSARRAVVERADETRHRLQRDLHDGAQQRMIALGLELSTMAGDIGCAARDGLEQAAVDAGSALQAVRRIAHREVPPLLDEQGLGEALSSLAEDTPIPIELRVGTVVGRRFASDVERAAYRFVSASADVARVDGSPMIVSVWTDDNAASMVVVTTSASGDEVADRTADVDRVEALGGTVRAHVRHGQVVYEARFPCE